MTRGHICAPLFLPAASSTGAGVNPTRRPLFDFVYPPHWGVSSPVSLTTTGAACALHAAPFLFFTPKGCFPPFWGDSFFFSAAGVLYSPPRIPAGIRWNPVDSGRFQEFCGMEILAVLPAKIVISVPRNSGGFRNGPGITRTESTRMESTEFFLIVIKF